MHHQRHPARSEQGPDHETELCAADLDALRGVDTCSLANAIETFATRLRNEGYAGPGLHCIFREMPPVLGFAVTARVRSSNPPVTGGAYFDRSDWWAHVFDQPTPRFAVVENLEANAAASAIAGEIHCEILRALGCVALVTNGAVRDLPAVRETGFALFANGVAPSHAYLHLVDFGGPVDIFGLSVRPGDLLCGDCHGLISIPHQLVKQLPAVLEELAQHERTVIDLCRSPEFSLERLRETVKNMA